MNNTIKKAVLGTAAAAATFGTTNIQVFAADTGSPEVTNAENTLVQATQTVDSAKRALDTASAALANANNDVTNLTNEKAAADSKLTDAQNALATAQANYETAKAQADAISEEDLANAQQAVDDATNNVNAAQTEADNAAAALDAANTSLSDASAKLSEAQNAYNSAVEAQTAAKQALDAAKADQAQKEADAKKAEEEKKAAEEASKAAEENAKQIEEENPNAEQNAANAQEASDDADQKQADAQTEADQAQTEKNTAEEEKNTAETAVNQAGTDVTNAEQNVTDKTSAREQAETDQTNAQTTLDNANEKLTEETAKAGDAQKKAEQEVTDQQAVVDQKKQEQSVAEKNLTAAKADQAEKQKNLDDVNTKLDTAKSEQSQAEQDLKAKQDALDAANTALQNANGDVTAKQQAVEDAKTAVDNAQTKVNQINQNISDLEANAADYQKQVDDAKATVSANETARDNAEKAVEEAKTIHKTVYAKDSDDDPGSYGAFVPNIPEANGHTITYSCPKAPGHYVTPEEESVLSQLNQNGKYIPTVKTLYYYKQATPGYYTYSEEPIEGEVVDHTETSISEKTVKHPYHLLATWTDDNGQEQSVPIELSVKSNASRVATDKFHNNCDEALASMNLDGKTWQEKAQAITDYVEYNFAYQTYNQSADMFTTGGGDCWASTNLICTLGEKAGFKVASRDARMDNGAGNGHRNALLEDPDGNEYICEAGDDRTQHQYKKGYVITREKGDVARTDKEYYYGSNGRIASDYNIIGRVLELSDETITLPDDPERTSLGAVVEMSSDNKDYELKNTNGDVMSYPFFSDPLEMCQNVKTVKVGKYITNISPFAYSYAYNGYDANIHDLRWFFAPKNIKFVVDPENPVYESTEDGGLVLKQNNYQGKAGTKIYTPDPNAKDPNDDTDPELGVDVSDDIRTANLAKATTDYNNAIDAYDSAKAKYDKLVEDGGSEKAIARAKSDLETAKTELDAAKKNKENAEAALENSKNAVVTADNAVNTANNDVTAATETVAAKKQAVTSAQDKVDTATNEFNTATGVVNEKAKAVEEAKQAVANAENELTVKQEAAAKGAPQSLLDAREAVENAKKDLEAKKQALTDAQKALEDATTDLTNKQENLKKAKEVLAVKEENLNTANANLVEKQNTLLEAKQTSAEKHAALDQANETYQKVREARTLRDTASSNLALAVQNLTSANNALELAKNAIPTKTTELNAATEKVAKLAEELGIAQDNCDAASLSAEEAQKLYDEHTKDLSDSKTEQTNAQSKLDDLKNTINRRDKLSSEIEELTNLIPEYEKDSNELESKLAKAREKATTAESSYRDAKRTYDALVEEQKKTADTTSDNSNKNVQVDLDNRTITYTDTKQTSVDKEPLNHKDGTFTKDTTTVDVNEKKELEAPEKTTRKTSDNKASYSQGSFDLANGNIVYADNSKSSAQPTVSKSSHKEAEAVVTVQKPITAKISSDKIVDTTHANTSVKTAEESVVYNNDSTDNKDHIEESHKNTTKNKSDRNDQKEAKNRDDVQVLKNDNIKSSNTLVYGLGGAVTVVVIGSGIVTLLRKRRSH